MKALIDMVREYVTDHKYKLTEDEDPSKLIFRYQLRNVGAWTYNDDEHFMLLITSGFSETVTEENATQALVLCQSLNAEARQLKFYVLGDAIVATTEFYVKNEEDFVFQLETALTNLVTAKSLYERFKKSL